MKRQMDVDEQGEEYPDNGERAIFFARGVLETVKKLRWTPDVIVCQGWMGAVVPLYIKKAYNDEPCFANTKIITSLFQKHLKNDLGSNFKKCVGFRGADAQLLSSYNETFNFVELGKLALDYSDGVVVASESVNKDLLDYAHEKQLPIMEYAGENYIQAYIDFINNVCE